MNQPPYQEARVAPLVAEGTAEVGMGAMVAEIAPLAAGRLKLHT